MTHHNPLDPEALSRASLERASKAIGADDFARYCFSTQSGLREDDPEQASFFEAIAIAGPDLEALRVELRELARRERLVNLYTAWIDDQIAWLTPCVEYWKKHMAQ